MQKLFFLTLDLEEWYHLDYFKDDAVSKKTVMLNNLTPFFNILDKYKIKITVFVLAELIKEHAKLIKNISNRGHEIAIHGWNHELLYNKTNEAFRIEIIKAKYELETLTKQKIIGYRAPCFSMDNEKLEILSEIGLKYDSSYIQFNEHPLYGNLSMKGFNQIDDLIYQKDHFYEFELVTTNVFGKEIPISGGGYFRFFPKLVFSFLWKKFLKKHHNYIMYIHPFELTEKKVNLAGISISKKLRFSLGRKNNLQNLEHHIKKTLKQGFKFNTIKNYVDNLEKS